jgi:hypothetical protein
MWPIDILRRTEKLVSSSVLNLLQFPDCNIAKSISVSEHSLHALPLPVAELFSPPLWQQMRDASSYSDLEICITDTTASPSHTPWPESSSELYWPSDRRLSPNLVPTIADRGSNVVNGTDHYGRFNFTQLTSAAFHSVIVHNACVSIRRTVGKHPWNCTELIISPYELYDFFRFIWNSKRILLSSRS